MSENTTTVTGYPLPRDMDEAADYAERAGALIVVNVNEGDGLEWTPVDAREYDENRAPGEPMEFVRYLFPEEQQQRCEAERDDEDRAWALAREACVQEGARERVRAALEPSAEVVEAVAEFAAMMGRVSTSAEHFTCAEAETVARLLRALGHSADAERFLDAHAAGDDEDYDQHRDRATAPARG